MKTVLVTGIGSGLGKEFFSQLVAKNHKVYGLLRNRKQYDDLSSLKDERSDFILADVSTDESIEQIRSVVMDTPIDLVINNAGIGGIGMTLDATGSKEIADLFQVHCLGVLRVMKAVSSNLFRSGSPTVINMNSRFGSISNQYKGTYRSLEVSYSYRIAKAAQNMLTNCLRNELGDRIEFISLTPGKVLTSLGQKDAQLSPREAVEKIIAHWEQGKLKTQNGILQVPDSVTEW